jgi:Dna[CI] antecedent, DciA
MPALRLGQYLGTAAGLKSLAREARRLDQLNRIVSRVSPELAPSVGAARVEAGVLILLADNAAVAAKLKQLAPRLTSSCRENGLEVTSIRVDVQVSGARAAAPQRIKKSQLPIEIIGKIEALAESLPDSPLRDAVRAMAVRQRRGRS